MLPVTCDAWKTNIIYGLLDFACLERFSSHVFPYHLVGLSQRRPLHLIMDYYLVC